MHAPVGWVLRVGTGLHHICEDLNQVLGNCSFLFAQSEELLFRLLRELAHAFEKHLDDLVLG
jgi:hypothetical protein